MGMGGGKGGGSSGAASTTVTNQPPQAILDAYSNLIKRGTDVSNQPYTPYTGQQVAPLTSLQNQGIQNISNSANIAQPYINQATGLANQSATNIAGNIPQYNSQNLQQYQDPYTQSVINATQANLNQNNAIQQQQLLGRSIQSGASPFGGDRAGIAAAELSREQNLANNQTIAGLQSQGFQNAQQEFNNQQQTQLQAQNADAARQAQAAYLIGGLGTSAQGAAMQGGLAQLQAGTVQQQQQQSELNVPYQQYLQKQAYPFATTQFLGNLVEGIGSNSGGSSITTPPAPSQVSQGLGGMLTGAGLGSAFSGGSSSGTMMGAGLGGLMSYFKDGGSVGKYDNGGSVVTSIIPWIPDEKLPIGHTIPGGINGFEAQSGLSSVGNIGSLLNLASSFGGGSSGGTSGGSMDTSGGSMDTSGMWHNPDAPWNGGGGQGFKNGGLAKYADGGSMPYSNPGVPNYGYIDPVSEQWVPKDNTSLFTPITTGGSPSSGSSKPKKGGWGGAATGAISGAEMGTSISPGWGTAIGGVLGGLAGYFLKDGGVVKYADGGTDDAGDSFEMPSEDIPYLGATQDNAMADANIASQLDDKPTIDHSGDTTKIIYPHEEDPSKRELDLGLPSPKGNIPISNTDHAHVKDNNNNIALPLLATGLAMMAGRSPYAAQNIGAGGLAGLQAYAQQQAIQRQQSQQELVNKRADQQQQYMQQKDKEAQDYRNQILELNKTKAEQGKFNMVPGIGQDEKGNQVQGTYVYNSKTGESEFRPGMVTGKGASLTPPGMSPEATKAQIEIDKKRSEAYNNNKPIIQNALRSLDNLEPNLDNFTTGSAGSARLAGNKAIMLASDVPYIKELVPESSKQSAEIEGTAGGNIDKVTNDLVTELQKFQYVPGQRGSVLGLKVLLGSKPGLEQPPQTNKNIISGLRAKLHDYDLSEQLAQQYKENNPYHVTDSTVDKLDSALKIQYPIETIDKSNPQKPITVFHPENVEKISQAIPDAVRNPDKYLTSQSAPHVPQQSAPTAATPPQAAIDHLRANPALSQAFERKYGIPAAQFLGQ